MKTIKATLVVTIYHDVEVQVPIDHGDPYFAATKLAIDSCPTELSKYHPDIDVEFN